MTCVALYFPKSCGNSRVAGHRVLTALSSSIVMAYTPREYGLTQRVVQRSWNHHRKLEKALQHQVSTQSVGLQTVRARGHNQGGT